MRGASLLLGRRRGLAASRRQRRRGERLPLAAPTRSGDCGHVHGIRPDSSGVYHACAGFTDAECAALFRQPERTDVSSRAPRDGRRDLYVYRADATADTNADAGGDDGATSAGRSTVLWDNGTGRPDLYVATANPADADATSAVSYPDSHRRMPMDGLDSGDARRDRWGRERLLT